MCSRISFFGGGHFVAAGFVLLQYGLRPTLSSHSNVMVVVLLVAVLLMEVIRQNLHIYHSSEAKGEGQL